MTNEQLQQLSQLWDRHMDAMKQFLATSNKAELDKAEAIAEQMKQIRESAER